MLVECSNCGAPLQVGESARSVRCGYCQRDNRVRSMRTLALVTPGGWTPPSVWTPPARFAAPSSPLNYNKTVSRALTGTIIAFIVITLISTLLPFLIIAVIFVVALMAGTT